MQPTLILLIIIVATILLGTLALLYCIQKYSGRTAPTSSTNKSLFAQKPSFTIAIKNLFSGTSRSVQDLLPELEEILLAADVGINATEKLVQKVQDQKDLQDSQQVFTFLKKEIQTLLTPQSEFVIDTSQKPYVIYVVGVNGVGKTTTIGKLACQFKEQGYKVLLTAADTFRAAAVEQLRIWADRNQVEFIAGSPNADPSSVIVDGLRSAKAKDCDVVLVDTAGRLQTKSNLMQELQKMTRMCEKELGKNPDEIFLVLDAITGQNGLSQAQIFFDAISLSGLILTKYDSTSKGGVILSVVEKTSLPVRYVGFGEKIADLKKFDSQEFVNRIF